MATNLPPSMLRSMASGARPASIAQATAAGLGVSLLPRFLIESELESGDLAVVLDKPLQSAFGYYLVTPVDRSEYAPVIAFKEWLLSIIEDVSGTRRG